MLDAKGLSNGAEQYERFNVKIRGNKWAQRMQYDYRDLDGELFSTIQKTLYDCHKAKDEWTAKKQDVGRKVEA
jgi:hypothetical protein